MIWQACDERAHMEDSLQNGDFMIVARPFIRVGDLVFQRNNINVVNLDSSDGYINVFTSDCTDDAENNTNIGYQLAIRKPETQAFIAWLTDEDRCLDVMTIDQETDTPTILEDTSDIRIEV